MQRITSLLRVVLVLAAGAAVSAQVPVQKEPHHKPLLDTLLLRILDIGIAPGETTLDHTHEYDIATVALGDASTRVKRPGEDWGAPRPRTMGSIDLVEYTGKPASHVVENIGQTPYHLIAVENYRTGTWPARKAITAPATTLLKETRAFAVYDVKLNAGSPATGHAHEVPTVVILVGGDITNQGTNGEEAYPVRGAGKWILVPAAQTHAIKVSGSGDAQLVEIEVR